MRTNQLKAKRLSLIIIGVIGFLLPTLLMARPVVPAAPPTGRTWVWVEPHWELVSAPPPGPYEWRDGYWDTRRNVWINGSWIKVRTRPGSQWVGGHFDSRKGVWISGYWGKPGKGSVAVSIGAPAGKKVPSRPPANKHWVWVEGHWELVKASPRGAYEWRAGYWDTKLGIWVSGSWISISKSGPAGHTWSDGYWDRTRGVWVPGGWKKGPAVKGPKIAPAPKPNLKPSPMETKPNKSKAKGKADPHKPNQKGDPHKPGQKGDPHDD